MIRSIIAEAMVACLKTPPQREKRQVGGQDDRGPLVPGETNWKNRLAACGVEGDIADFVDDDQSVAADLAGVRPEAVDAMRFGQARLIQPVAGAKATRCPA